jgi:hypothetical protein
VAFQDCDDVILWFCGTLRRDQKCLDSTVGPARNHCLHGVARLRVEGFHDQRMPRTLFICTRGNLRPQGETQPNVDPKPTILGS